MKFTKWTDWDYEKLRQETNEIKYLTYSCFIMCIITVILWAFNPKNELLIITGILFFLSMIGNSTRSDYELLKKIKDLEEE
jgi:hypothetical protein